MKLYTIGFTKTTAAHFFERLKNASVRILIDTRLHREGQLSGFAKMPDLEYFLTNLTSATYRYEPLLAPSEDILKGFRTHKLTWGNYEDSYRALLLQRNVASTISHESLDQACLLCSEAKPDRCHRRLAADYLRSALSPSVNVDVIHL